MRSANRKRMLCWCGYYERYRSVVEGRRMQAHLRNRQVLACSLSLYDDSFLLPLVSRLPKDLAPTPTSNSLPISLSSKQRCPMMIEMRSPFHVTWSVSEAFGSASSRMKRPGGGEFETVLGKARVDDVRHVSYTLYMLHVLLRGQSERATAGMANVLLTRFRVSHCPQLTASLW